MLDYLRSKKLLIKHIAYYLLWLNRLKRKIKGSLRDPSLYLPSAATAARRLRRGLCSFRLMIIAIFLLIFVSASFGLIIKSLAGKSDFYSFEEPEKNNLFIGSAKRFLPESPEFILVENSILKASSPPTTFLPQVLGALVAGYELEDTRMVITEYLVEGGDSLGSLTAKFNISLDTILWANNLNKNSILKTGQKLVILPVSGVIHHVKDGDTISNIAKTYKGKVDEIIAFNYISSEGDIYIGDIIIVPNGLMPPPPIQGQQAPASIPLASSYFIVPVSSPYIISQGLHWYNAIDFSHKGSACDKPIFAAAGGTVLKVQLTNSTSRWAFGGAGNHITILHPNGVVTMYGHIAASLVKPGDSVSQGDRIALIGGQPGTPGAGISTGCHLHFGVIGARNPFAR